MGLALNCPTSSPSDWIALAPFVSAIAVFTIGLGTIYIARRQWETAHTKLKLELYDRRLPTMKAIQALFAAIRQNPTSGDITPFIEFNTAVADAPFLFDERIVNYIKECRNKAGVYVDAREELDEWHANARSGQEDLNSRRDIQKRLSESRAWMNEQQEEMTKLFGPYLRLEGNKTPLRRLGFKT
jgi:hypothetical protein